MSLKNLIVKGKFFRWIGKGQIEPNKISEELVNIQSVIKHYFQNTGYYESLPPSILYNYANFEFQISTLYPTPVPPKKGFFKSNKEPDNNSEYFKKLRSLKISATNRINVNTDFGMLNNDSVIFVEMISEPAIIQQYQQLQIRPSLNQDDIDLIIYENEQTIERFGKACLLKVVEKPTPFGGIFKTDISEKLRIYGFKEIADLLEKGREDTEKGHSEDGLVDLRTAIERFFVLVIESKGEKPAAQKDINKNIDKLHGLGYIDDYTHQLLLKLSYNGLYTTLSSVTHDRISRDYFDTRFQFNIAEQIFDYILERVIRLKLSSAKKS